MKLASKSDLLSIIDDMRALVGAGDSLEGFLNYLAPEAGDPEWADFRVEARYRTGNLAGQGGMRMIGVTVREGVT